jgi:hypothetical protein
MALQHSVLWSGFSEAYFSFRHTLHDFNSSLQMHILSFFAAPTMDGVSGTSSVLAVVSIAIQLAEGVNKLHKLYPAHPKDARWSCGFLPRSRIAL